MCGSRTKRRMPRRWLAILAALAVSSAAIPMEAYAEENVIGPSGTGYPRSKWDRLMDNVLEYDEIPDLVHEFNTSISQGWDKIQDAQKDMENYIQDLESHELKIKHLKDDAKDNGDILSLVTHEVQLSVFDTVLLSLKESTSSMTVSTGTVNSIKKGENQIVMAAQSLMINYDSLLKQKVILDHMADMYEEQYRLVADKRALGMATDEEVHQAQVNQLSAASLSADIANYLLQLKPTICTLTGWRADADPEFVPIPEMDQSVLGSMDLDADTKKAIGNNSMLIGQRTSAKGKTNDGIAARLGCIAEGDEKMAIKMQSLYHDVFAKQTAYEAAKDGLKAAAKDREKADRMYQLGYLSRSDYLGMQIAYYQADADCQAASTALRLAAETYRWAVKGLVNPD